MHHVPNNIYKLLGDGKTLSDKDTQNFDKALADDFQLCMLLFFATLMEKLYNSHNKVR